MERHPELVEPAASSSVSCLAIVWQMYNIMVEILQNPNLLAKEKVDQFVCAGGTMAHYVGDAWGRDSKDPAKRERHKRPERIVRK
jgi:hypothetical protein